MTNKQIIHRVTSDIQFLYPCIAYEESLEENILVIKAETKVSKIYEVIPFVKKMKYMGKDYFHRHLFQDDSDNYFCDVDGELYFKGSDPEGDPLNVINENIEYIIPDIDSDLIQFDECINKVENYAKENKLDLIDVKKTYEENIDVFQGKIYCLYTFKLESH